MFCSAIWASGRAVGNALVHRDDEQHGGVAQHARHEVERDERALVDGLQVVHEDHDRAVRAAHAQQRDERVEERKAGDVGVLVFSRGRVGRRAAARPAPAPGAEADRPRRRARGAGSLPSKSWVRPRTTSTQGQYAGAARPQPRVQITRAPAAPACSASAAASRVLPTPGSPSTRWTPPRPPRASSNASCSSCSSRTRPTSGPSPGEVAALITRLSGRFLPMPCATLSPRERSDMAVGSSTSRARLPTSAEYPDRARSGTMFRCAPCRAGGDRARAPARRSGVPRP